MFEPNVRRASLGLTALIIYSLAKISKALNFLVAEGADLQIKDSQGGSPLHWAVSGEQDKCIHALLEAGANINAMNNRGETALHFAATPMEWPMDLVIKCCVESGIAYKNMTKKEMIAAIRMVFESL